MPRTLQRAILREAATVMLQGGAAPVEVAKQLAESSETGDRQAIVTLREAARTCRAQTRRRRRLSVRALELMAPGDEGRPAGRSDGGSAERGAAVGRRESTRRAASSRARCRPNRRPRCASRCRAS